MSLLQAGGRLMRGRLRGLGTDSSEELNQSNRGHDTGNVPEKAGHPFQVQGGSSRPVGSFRTKQLHPTSVRKRTCIYVSMHVYTGTHIYMSMSRLLEWVSTYPSGLFEQNIVVAY